MVSAPSVLGTPGGSVAVGYGRNGTLYQPEIDGLRAFAVLAVVLYHADARLLPGGYVGVDIFFVISGFVITRLLAGELATTGAINFAAFYARRVRRLLPALAVMVVAVLVAAVTLLARHGAVFERTAESAAASLLFVANFYFQSQFGDYFDTPAERMPLLHLWSLSVEEQFYLVFPLLLLLLWRLIPSGIARWMSIFATVSFLVAEYWVHIVPDRAFHQMVARFWEFAAGALVALATQQGGSIRARSLFSWLGLIVTLLASVLTSRIGYFPGGGAIPAVAGTTMLLWGLHQGGLSPWVQRLLCWRPLVAIGAVSYSLYLWHWPLLTIDDNLRIEPAPIGWRLALCLLAILLAWASWRWVELPCRRSRASANKMLLAGVGATLVLVVASLVTTQLGRIPEHVRRMVDEANAELEQGGNGCHFENGEVVPSLKPASCWSNPMQRPTVVIWGDSHAWAWKPFAWRLAEDRKKSAMAITMNSCPPTGVSRLNAPERGCPQLNQQAVAWLAQNPIDTLIIALRWPRWPAGRAAQDGLPTLHAGLLHGVEEAIARIDPETRILVMGPLPVMRRLAPECIGLGWEDQCAQLRTDYDAWFQRVRRELWQLQSRHPNLVVVDPSGYFCDGKACPVARDGHALYSDTNHVTATAARAFAERYLADPSSYTLRAPDDIALN